MAQFKALILHLPYPYSYFTSLRQEKGGFCTLFSAPFSLFYYPFAYIN
jgi:hypothetical protein